MAVALERPEPARPGRSAALEHVRKPSALQPTQEEEESGAAGQFLGIRRF